METTNDKSTTMQNEAGKGSNASKNKRFGSILLVIVVVGSIAGLLIYRHAIHHESTENAQIETNISPVISRVPGYVDHVYVNDNQFVTAGDTLLVLDSRDFMLRVKEAEAALAMAKSNLEVAKQTKNVSRNQVLSADAGVTAADVSIETAKVRQWRAQKDFERYENLWKNHTITEQQYEQALAEKQAADRQLELLQKQREIALQQSKTTTSQSAVTSSQIAVAEAAVQQREAALEEAKLNLSYTVITAKYNGQLSAVGIEAGQLIQAGQALFNVVSTENYWVVANFKETQVTRMEAGQEVEVKLDAFPGHEFHGKITSFSPATGNKFALLPADNSTGNFVKVVQKIPVKIEFENVADDPFMKRIKAGMNAEVDVYIN